MHTFPKDNTLRKTWVHLCGRADFTVKDVTHTSRLCSKHFKDSDYMISPSVAKSVGMSFKPTLIPGAVPSIFTHRPMQRERCSQAVMKRRKLQVRKYFFYFD